MLGVNRKEAEQGRGIGGKKLQLPLHLPLLLPWGVKITITIMPEN